MTGLEVCTIAPPEGPEEILAVDWLRLYAIEHGHILADLYLDAVASEGKLQIVILDRKGGTLHHLTRQEAPELHQAIGLLVGPQRARAVTIGAAGVRYDPASDNVVPPLGRPGMRIGI